MNTIVLATVMENFSAALLIMLQGMAGIFLFMAIFYLLIYGLEKLFKPKSAK
ncbi:MAG TPA: OadG-related small transporter subunit [Candidatus Cloacimonadota bacterium]|nr:OadG-related small transporter subunit [Candidatus Cloacimonadota bacterium]